MPSTVPLEKRYQCYYENGYRYCYATAWDTWIRWVVLAIVIIGFFLLFAICSCTSARRRRRAGRMPYYGTGWAAGNGRFVPQQNNQAYYHQNGDPNNQWGQPAPPYTPNPQYYQNNGYYGQQQNGVELNSNISSPPPAHARAGDNVYQPPAGPPPGKGDGVIR